MPTGPYCWAHDPERADERRQARANGGKNSARGARLLKLAPPRLVPVLDTLELAMREVHDGRITPQQASAMASLASAMVRALTVGELEERLRKIEEMLSHGA